MLSDTRLTLGCVGLTYDNLEAGRRSEYQTLMTKDDLLPYLEEQERELVTMRQSHCAIRANNGQRVYTPYTQPDPIPFGLLLAQDADLLK